MRRNRSTNYTKNHEGHIVVPFMKFFVSFVFFVLFLSNTVFSQQTERQYLSGTGNDNTINWDFFCTTGMNSGKWSTIAVPSCWELQGFGKYDYGFSKDNVRGKEKGLYKYTFSVPASWKTKKVNIVFEGSMTDTEVKVNGQLAGTIHQGAFYAFKYDISSLLKFDDKNLLEVTVAKHSANESVNAAERRADFWIFGGIFRPVWLEALPLQHIERIIVNAGSNGEFTADIVTRNKADKITIQLFTADGKKYGNLLTANTNNNNHTVVANKYPSPSLWSSEFPNLYKAVISLYDKGKLVHTISQNTGFRTVEVRQRDGIYLNDVKIKMKGVNRHSFWPTSGRTTNKQISIDDVLMMKDMNMNAVRMSHYPPDDHFLKACDSLGLFVIDELAGWHGYYDDSTGKKLVREMMMHDRNHPSIIIWANGNEGGHNNSLDDLFAGFELEPRPVIHPWQLFGGIETQHYREYNYGIGNYDHGHDIVMPTEFLHGLYDGGHGAGLEDYWEAMWRNPLSAGGFLWDFADQGVLRKDRNDSIDTDGNHGADGIVGPFHEKEASYYAIKEIWSPVVFEKKEITPAFDGKLNMENRYHFTNIDQCRFTWQLKKSGGDDLKTGNIIPPHLKPSEKGSLQIKLPPDWKDYDVLYVTGTDKYKREIFTWSWSLKKPTLNKYLLAGTGAVNPATSMIMPALTDTVFTVDNGPFLYTFSRKTGRLVQVKNGTAIIPLSNGPVLCEGFAEPDSVLYREDNGNIIIESKYKSKSLISSLQWTIYSTGWLKMDIHYFPAAYFTSMVGVNFSFPEKDMKAIEYMGNGPYRVWKNRMKGNRFGIWRKEYNDTETGESWNYPEFKGYHSNMYWCRFITGDRSFKVYTENEDLFFRLFTPAWKTDQWHNYEPIFPSGDISFMQGIPGIGSKTQRNETTGPMGMKNIFYDYEKDPARALNMILYFDFTAK